MPAPRPVRAAGRAFRRDALFFVEVLLIYVTCGDGPWSRDTLPARYLPLSLLAEADFDLDEFPSSCTTRTRGACGQVPALDSRRSSTEATSPSTAEAPFEKW